MTVTRKWSMMAAILILAILAAGWFLLISPKRGEAAELRTQGVTQEDANARLTQQISVLQAQQSDLPKQRARLAVFKTRIPSNPALPTLIRDLTAAGRKVGVTIDTMAPSLPVVVAGVLPVAAPVAPAADASATESSGTTAETAPVTPVAPVVAAPSLYQVPLSLTVTASYFELEQFVNKLEGLKRSFLVTGFTVGAPSGDAATDGDLTLTLQGRVFLSPPASTTIPTTPAAPAAPAPVAQ